MLILRKLAGWIFGNIVSVLHQDEGGIGKSIPDAQKISRDLLDFPRAKPEGNLEGRGKSGGRKGWISQYLPSFGGARTISHHQQGRIDFNTVNPSLSTGKDFHIYSL